MFAVYVTFRGVDTQTRQLFSDYRAAVNNALWMSTWQTVALVRILRT